MFVEQLRQAVAAAPRDRLPEVTKALWAAFAAGQVTEEDAEALSRAIEARTLLKGPQAPVRRSVGSRPRSPASLERRRRWAASGLVPAQVACRFTVGEAAVLAVIAMVVTKHGDCRWPIGQIASVAGVSETTAKRALREARALGLITITERRLGAWRNDTNIVQIVGREWVTWLSLRGRGGGQFATPTNNKIKSKAKRSRGSGVPNPATWSISAQQRRFSGGRF